MATFIRCSHCELHLCFSIFILISIIVTHNFFNLINQSLGPRAHEIYLQHLSLNSNINELVNIYTTNDIIIFNFAYGNHKIIDLFMDFLLMQMISYTEKAQSKTVLWGHLCGQGTSDISLFQQQLFHLDWKRCSTSIRNLWGINESPFVPLQTWNRQRHHINPSHLTLHR